MKTIKNEPDKAGQLAGKKERFGDFGRYAVAAVNTRFEAVQWFVWDAERMDEDGRPSIIRQSETKEEAMRGLAESAPFHDVDTVTDYGVTAKLPQAIRVF